MVQLPVPFLGITLYFIVWTVLGAFAADIESAPQSLALDPSEAADDSTSMPIPVSTFLLCIKITNRIFSESLKDSSSEDYKTLRDEVTQLLDDVYSTEAHGYTGISEMTFSKGSVVANTTLKFKTKEIAPSKIKNLFLSHVKKNPPANLHLNISFTEEQELPLPDIELQETELQSETHPPTTITTHQHSTRETNIASTIHHTSKSPSSTTSAELKVSETTYVTWTTSVTLPTKTTHTIPNTATSQSKTNSASSTEFARSPQVSATATANSMSHSTAVTSLYTPLTVSVSSSTKHPLTHSTRDSITTTPPLSSHTPPSVTHSVTRVSTMSTDSTSHTTNVTSSRGTDVPFNGTTHHPVTNNYNGTTVHTLSSTVTDIDSIASHSTAHHHSTEITNTAPLSNITPQTLNRTTIQTTSVTAHQPANGTASTLESSSTTLGMTMTPHTASAHPSDGSTTRPASSVTHTTASMNSPPPGDTTASPVAPGSTAKPPSSPAGPSSAGTSTPSNTVAAADGNNEAVPGWAIALLVLAALILFFLLLLIITLLVYWCCKRRQYGFVNMSEEPGIYENHGADIPMYTTHSHFESPNGKPYEDTEKPMKNRAMYVVNKE